MLGRLVERSLRELARDRRADRTGGLPVRLAPQPVFLAGRQGLLEELDIRLADGSAQSGPRLVALCGLGGVGKTSLAVEYANRHLAEARVCWQFAAEDPGAAGSRVRRAGRPTGGVGDSGLLGSGGIGSRGAGPRGSPMAAGVRQRNQPRIGRGVHSARRAWAGADNHPVPALAARSSSVHAICLRATPSASHTPANSSALTAASEALCRAKNPARGLTC
jgi:hypothetical protein